MGAPYQVTETSEPPVGKLEFDTFVGFPDFDAGPMKAWLIQYRNDPQWKQHYDWAFGKRPGEELYDLAKDHDQVRNVADDPAYAEKKKENFKARMTLDPEMKCYLPGVPRANYMGHPFQIVQSQKHIMLIHEYAGAVRTIYMTDQVEAPADSWMGWSNGRWDGESLVVDTKGFNDLSWFDRAGNFHSDALHVVERFTARSADTLNYEATIEDPKTFTRPWKISMPLYRRVEPNAQIMEFRCVEFSEDLLYGHLKKQPKQ